MLIVVDLGVNNLLLLTLLFLSIIACLGARPWRALALVD
jgi:hypothetical protein